MILNSNGTLLNVMQMQTIRGTIMNWEVDASGNVLYKGEAAPGTPNSVAGWKIEKVVNPTPPGVGTIRLSRENQIWDNRATSVEYF